MSRIQNNSKEMFKPEEFMYNSDTQIKRIKKSKYRQIFNFFS